MQNVTLNQIDIGGGLVATQVWLAEGPIVLISARPEGGGRESTSRFDLQKAMFIDPLPGERSIEGLRALITFVRASLSRSLAH